MRTRTRFLATALVLAVAAPIAISQAPTTPESAQAGTRMLPSTAASYADYQGNVTQVMSKELGSAAELNKHIQSFGSVNINQLSSGWISYGAILAAQNPDFAKDVRESDAAYGRERAMAYFSGSPTWARSFKGADAALQAALTVNAHETARISSAGAFMKKQSYEYATKYGNKTVDGATTFDINKTLMRCLVKNLAMFGLGIYIYAGEDLPEAEASAPAPAPAPAKAKPSAELVDLVIGSDNWKSVEKYVKANKELGIGKIGQQLNRKYNMTNEVKQAIVDLLK